MVIVGKLDSEQLMCVTKVKVRVQQGDQGPKAGVVFISREDPSTLNFDSWTSYEDYKKAEKRCGLGVVCVGLMFMSPCGLVKRRSLFP